MLLKQSVDLPVHTLIVSFAPSFDCWSRTDCTLLLSTAFAPLTWRHVHIIYVDVFHYAKFKTTKFKMHIRTNSCITNVRLDGY
jgi:hypothetical protein